MYILTKSSTLLIFHWFKKSEYFLEKFSYKFGHIYRLSILCIWLMLLGEVKNKSCIIHLSISYQITIPTYITTSFPITQISLTHIFQKASLLILSYLFLSQSLFLYVIFTDETGLHFCCTCHWQPKNYESKVIRLLCNCLTCKFLSSYVLSLKKDDKEKR